jgi:host factor-I protein
MWSSIPVEGASKRNRILVAPGASILQDTFLKHLRDGNFEVMLFLVNGIRLQSRIARFDNYTVQLMRGSSSQVIFKHAILAIYLVEPVQLTDPTLFG